MEITPITILLSYLPVFSFVFVLFKYSKSNVNKQIERKMDTAIYEEKRKSDQEVQKLQFKVYDQKIDSLKNQLTSIVDTQKIIQEGMKEGITEIKDSIKDIFNKLDKIKK